MGPLDNRFGQAGVPNGSLPSMVETNVVRYLVTIVVNVLRLTLSLGLRHLLTGIREINNGGFVVLMIVVLLL